MHLETIQPQLFNHLHKLNAALPSDASVESHRLLMLARCQNLLTELDGYATYNPQLILLQTRVQTLLHADLSALDLRQQLVEELKLALLALE
jgi:hypothetical protein